MPDWDPSLYLKFRTERMRPVCDLISRIEISPLRILDIGCGPGSSTSELKNKFSAADITGMDFSSGMIRRAEAECPGVKFIVGDASEDISRLGKFDLVFSNAALQWMPRHGVLLKRYFDMLEPGGALAVQVPEFDTTQASRVIGSVASMPEYIGFFAGFDTGMRSYPTEYYYDLLSGITPSAQLWKTCYYHEMQSPNQIMEFMRSTVLKPYVERLPKEFQPYFLMKVGEGIEKNYPARKNGKVLFKIGRIFFIAYNKRCVSM